MKTDSKLREDIDAELKWEPSVHSTQIGVAVKDGIVTLTGEVGSYAEKWSAERAAQRVAGVKALAVELTVNLSGSGKRSDSDIARSVKNVLDWSAYLPQDSVKIMVEAGRITLGGEVEWQYQKQAAVQAVRSLLGVTGVVDSIVLKPKLTASSVKDHIEAALRRGAYAEADAISVGVQGNEITLSGTVHNWAERDRATHAAWGSPGVRNVVDKMTLVA